jgi:radical SAM protein with 4Fe4S-binding SPASM domain
MTERNQTKNISGVKFTDIEKILAEKFGDRFLKYRRDYKKSLNYDKNNYVPDFPLTVSFELVNRCNLKCIMCWTENHSRPKATLDLEAIGEILSECQDNHVPAAVVGMGAEMLLYKDVREVLAGIRGAGIMDLFVGTNATLLTPDMAMFMVEQQVARVEVSLDAATPETYQKIRGKDELELVEQNVRGLVEAKKKAGSKLPVIRLCFCVQPENVDERQMFIDKWRDIVDYVDFQEMCDFTYVTPLLDGDESDVPTIEDDEVTAFCPYPFNSLNIWSDGNVTPCCTFYGKALKMGNINESTLKEIWNGESIKALREEFFSGKLNTVCKACLYFRDTENFSKAKASTEVVSMDSSG